MNGIYLIFSQECAGEHWCRPPYARCISISIRFLPKYTQWKLINLIRFIWNGRWKFLMELLDDKLFYRLLKFRGKTSLDGWIGNVIHLEHSHFSSELYRSCALILNVNSESIMGENCNAFMKCHVRIFIIIINNSLLFFLSIFR